MYLKIQPFRHVQLSIWKVLAVAVICVVLVVGPLAALVAAVRRPVFRATPGTEAIVFRAGRDRGINLYVMHLDGTQQTRLTNMRLRPTDWLSVFFSPYADLVTNFRPQPAPDGQGITFISNFEGENLFYQIHLDGSGLRSIPSPLAGNTGAVLSPDGQRLAYLRTDGQLAVINRDGSDERCLTCGTAGAPSIPAWSPDSTQIVFPFQEGDQPNLYRINVDGTHLQRLTHTPGAGNVNPAWSPDGQHIVFRSDRAGDTSEIYVMNEDGSNQQRLTTGGGIEPSWSPDGRRIVFVAGPKGGSAEIYVMNADGSAQTRLTFNNSSDNEPIWVRVSTTP